MQRRRDRDACVDRARSAAPRRDARAVVPQPRPRRRADRARRISSATIRREVAALRARAARAISRGTHRARHRLQRRLLLDRDEAPRRRARGRHRLRPGLPGAGALRRRGAAGSRSSSGSSRSTTWRRSGERFDLVLFMGVLYHLRHPLLALDLIHEHVARRPAGVPVHAARQRPRSMPSPRTTRSARPDVFDEPGLSASCTSSSTATPAIRTNWWIPNRACVEAMLRSAGFEILDHPEEEVFLCRGAS